MAPVSLFLRSVSRLKSPMETLTLTSRRLFSPLSTVQPSPNFSVWPPPPPRPPYPADLIPFIRSHLPGGNQEEDAGAGSEVEEKFDRHPKAKDFESEDSLRHLYERWLAYHKLSRPDPSEKEARFQIFKEKAKRIYEFNERGTETCTQGLTQFVDSDWRKGYPSSIDFIYTTAAKEIERRGFCYTEQELESEYTIWSLYERWLKYYRWFSHHRHLSGTAADKRDELTMFKQTMRRSLKLSLIRGESNAESSLASLRIILGMGDRRMAQRLVGCNLQFLMDGPILNTHSYMSESPSHQ